MRVMVIVKASAESEAGKMPDTGLLEEMGRFNEALVKAGILLAGEGLHPTSRGARVAFAASAGRALTAYASNAAAAYEPSGTRRCLPLLPRSSTERSSKSRASGVSPTASLIRAPQPYRNSSSA